MGCWQYKKQIMFAFNHKKQALVFIKLKPSTKEEISIGKEHLKFVEKSSINDLLMML